ALGAVAEALLPAELALVATCRGVAAAAAGRHEAWRNAVAARFGGEMLEAAILPAPQRRFLQLARLHRALRAGGARETRPPVFSGRRPRCSWREPLACWTQVLPAGGAGPGIAWSDGQRVWASPSLGAPPRLLRVDPSRLRPRAAFARGRLYVHGGGAVCVFRAVGSGEAAAFEEEPPRVRAPTGGLAGESSDLFSMILRTCVRPVCVCVCVCMCVWLVQRHRQHAACVSPHL
ncbi:unnamed protein product, partial [Prorocentrum cordatum]